ncbi:EamA family transporter RarD [Jiella sp. M17.18]|uniref:EamA family transporter RarD n=1 Tax=Jiella sp. M17.18 TaxID=3234247 RepID=UPI0034E053A5
MQTVAQADRARGLSYALTAYTLWGGIFPLYMKLLDHLSPFEIVAHRIIWAIPFAALILSRQHLLRDVGCHFRNPRTLALAALTATLISVNWGTYVYAIVAGHAVAAALGYYINPLVNVLLAAIFLGERPSRLQSVAILLAAIGVGVMTVKAGGLPWISLVLAGSFGTYGLLRKTVPVGASEGFFLEVVILFIPSLLMLWLLPGERHFGANGWETALLVGAGPLTAVPLILFAAGARLLSFATVGILQYIVPTLLVLIAVLVFGEPFDLWKLVAFAFIWSALAIYSVTLFRRRRQPNASPAASKAPAAAVGTTHGAAPQR